jgi:hypothetical protein
MYRIVNNPHLILPKTLNQFHSYSKLTLQSLSKTSTKTTPIILTLKSDLLIPIFIKKTQE